MSKSLVVILLTLFSIYFLIVSLNLKAVYSIAALCSFLFWSLLLYLLLSSPLKSAFTLTLKTLKRRSAVFWVFPVYLAAHLFAYGFLLETLFSYRYGFIPTNVVYAYVSYTYTASTFALWRVLYSFAVNPVVVVVLPKGFGATLSVYSFFIGILDAFLVSANIERILELSSLWKKRLSTLGIPLVSVVSGSGCCISLPSVLAVFSPAIQALLVTSGGVILENALYFALPFAVALALYFNLRALYPKLKVNV